MKQRSLYISVIGAGYCGPEVAQLARRVGQEIARRGHILVCGGLGGVMEAAAEGAFKAGGKVIGILPGNDRSAANSYLTASVITGMGHGRNYLVALSGDAIIAVAGEYGTLAEISFGLKLGRPVVLLRSWEPTKLAITDPCLMRADSAPEAVELAEQAAGR